MDFNQYKELFFAAASNSEIHTEQGNLSGRDLNYAAQEMLKEMNVTGIGARAFNKIKPEMFELIAEAADDAVPAKVAARLGFLADVRTLREGQKAIFHVKKGRNRAKNFVTKVGLGGVYESFRLDRSEFQLEPKAYGAAIQYQVEEFLTGAVSPSELMDLIVEGFEYKVYKEIAAALLTIESDSRHPAANYATHAGYDYTKMRNLLVSAQTYGEAVTIFCTKQFAVTLYNTTGWQASEVNTVDMAELRDQGYVGTLFGAKVVIIPNSYTDETNVTWELSNQNAYIMATSANEAPVKVVFEGDTIVREDALADFSTEIHAYKKFDIGLVSVNHVFIYNNSSL